jgi:dTMP kinase
MTDIEKQLHGKFIVLDGPDGSGKTVQLELLAAHLANAGVAVVQTNDPGGTKIGDQISNLLKYDAQGVMNVQTEVMLFMASRAQLVGEVVKPALEAGKTVLCDRFISSTCAYQGSSGYPVDKIIELGRFAVEDVWPDLTVIIDIPVEEGLGRAGRKPRQKTKVSRADSNQSYLFNNAVVDRFDSRPLRYHTRVRRGFLKLAHYYPGIVRTVDGSQGDIKTVHERILQVISEVSFT